MTFLYSEKLIYNKRFRRTFKLSYSRIFHLAKADVTFSLSYWCFVSFSIWYFGCWENICIILDSRLKLSAIYFKKLKNTLHHSAIFSEIKCYYVKVKVVTPAFSFKLVIVIFFPSYLKLFKPLIMWGDTSNIQCLPHAAYFRKFWSNSITSKSAITEECTVQ